MTSRARLALGTIVLMLSGATGLVAWSVLTCAGGSALSYTTATVQLAAGYFGDGLSACSERRNGQEFPEDGREPLFIALWFLVCTSFWGGLVPVVVRAIRVYGGSSNGD